MKGSTEGNLPGYFLMILSSLVLHHRAKMNYGPYNFRYQLMEIEKNNKVLFKAFRSKTPAMSRGVEYGNTVSREQGLGVLLLKTKTVSGFLHEVFDSAFELRLGF